MRPSIGRIVVYNDNGQEWPAIVVRVWQDDCVNLRLFTDVEDEPLHSWPPVVLRSIVRGERGEYGRWSWPERV